jgi:hypothetical protein
VNRHLRDTRAGGARVFAAVLLTAVVAAACAALPAAGRVAAAAPPTTVQSVLTLRTTGDHDAVWLVSAEGTATAAGTLPGIAEAVCVSPDGSTVAYLPSQGRPFIWIGHGPLGPRTISLQAAGIKGVGGLTWIAADRLMISASTSGRYYDLYTARLFTVDVKTGSVEGFRDLRGAEPSADPTTGKMTYVRFKKLDNGNAKNDHTPRYRESMMLTQVTGSGTDVVLDSAEYRLYYEQRAFSQPLLAPGAEWIMAGRTGSDPEVTYTLYDGVGYANLWMTLFAPSPQAAAWAPGGGKVAFTGVPESPADEFDDGCVYVMDVGTGVLLRTPKSLLTGLAPGWLDGVAWAADGSLVVDALESNVPGQSGKVLLIGAGLDTARDLGEGRLSVWVK